MLDARCVIVVAAVAQLAAGQWLFPAGQIPTACTSGANASVSPADGLLVDLDQDGDLDLVGRTTAGSPAIVVCKSAGGTFVSSTCYPTAQYVFGLALADFDGNGSQDVVGLQSFNSLVVGLNNGTGGLALTVIAVGVPPSYTAVKTGNFNNDGIPDVVMVNGAGLSPTVILMGTGGGSFAAPITGPVIGQTILVQDDDLDGDDDLHQVAAPNFVTYRNNGAGVFAAPIARFPVASSQLRAAFGDINLDGVIDVLTAGSQPGSGASFIQVAYGNAAGVLTAAPIKYLGFNDAITWITLADFDGNGYPDLLAWTSAFTAFSGTGGALQALNFGAASWAAVSVNEAPCGGIAVGDLTNDGVPDALFLGFSPGGLPAALEIGVLGTGLAHPNMVPVPGTNGYGDFHVTDLDGDGRPDALAVFSPHYIGQPGPLGVNTFKDIDSIPTVAQSIITWPIMASEMATGDWNRDGFTDVVLSDVQSSAMTPELRMLLGGPGGVLQLPVVIPTGAAAETLTPADVNKDGMLDLVCTHTWAVSVWLGNGNGGLGSAVWTPICPGSGCLGNPVVAVEDLDRDGNLDLLVAISALFGAGSANYTVYLGNGTGSFTPQPITIFSSPVVAQTLAVKDLNGDTIPDMLVCTPPAAVEVRLGLGNGSFGPAITSPIPGGIGVSVAQPLAMGDLNGDGLPDVALTTGESLLNTGAGGFAPHETVLIPGSGGGRVAIVDTNLDLQQDVVFWTGFPDGWISIFHNMTPCTATGSAYGFGCPGSGGFVPALSARGCASPGGFLTLTVEDALGGSTSAAFVVGAGPTNIQVGGGCGILIQLGGSFVVPFALTGLPVPGQGRATVPVFIPPTILPGTSLALQVAVLDPASPFQWAASNGLSLTIQ